MFVVLRDGGGSVQIVVDDPHLLAAASELKPDWLVIVDGHVNPRSPADARTAQASGHIEVAVARLAIRSRGASPPPWASGTTAPTAIAGKLRDALGAVGLQEVEADAPVALRSLLPSMERVYRIRSAAVTDPASSTGWRQTRLVEVELGFSPAADLHVVIDRVASKLAGDLTRRRPLRITANASSLGAEQPAELVLITQLPPRGHPLLEGCDWPLIASSQPANGTEPGAAECMLLAGNGRLIGVGAMRRDDAERPRIARELRERDPLGCSIAIASHESGVGCVPGASWFVLDVDLLLGCVASLESTAREAHGPARLPRDFLGLLNAAHAWRADAPRSEEAETACLAQRLEAWDIDASAAMAISRGDRRSGDNDRRDRGFGALLADFSMDAAACQQLFALFPRASDRVWRMPLGERFMWLWAILGREGPRQALTDEKCHSMLASAVAANVITDARQLSVLDVDSVRQLGSLLGAPSAAAVTPPLRRVLSDTPAVFTALVAALCELAESNVDHPALPVGPLPMLAREWLCSPGLLPIALDALASDIPLDAVSEATRQAGRSTFANVPLDEEKLAACLADQLRVSSSALAEAVANADSARTALGVLHHVYRPSSLTYPRMKALVSTVADCRQQLASAGLRFGGRHWDGDLQAFRFAGVGDDQSDLLLYPTKSVASFLAKGSAGICTAPDVELFERGDHLHLNAVDHGTGVCVGNVQLHVIEDRSRRILLVRAINMSLSFLRQASAAALVDAVLIAAVELAAISAFDEVHLGEGLCFWHLDSVRPAVRARLLILRERLPVVQLQTPLYLFRFGDNHVELSKTYRLWSADERDATPLHDLVGAAGA